MKNRLCRLLWIAALTARHFVTGIAAEPGNSTSAHAKAWDETLPQLQCGLIEIKEPSLVAAWQRIATRLMARSVLVAPIEGDIHRPFEFNRSRCSVQEVYDALIDCYPEYIWSQDATTGMAWFEPRHRPIPASILFQVETSQDQFGLPFYSGVCRSLEAEATDAVLRVARRGFLFLHTFDFAVDVPKGRYDVRSLLNLCLSQHPMKAAVLGPQPEGYVIVTPLNLFDYDFKEPRPGERHFWKTLVAPASSGEPTDQEVIEALCSKDRRVRWAAASYCQMVSARRYYYDYLLKVAETDEQRLWIALALTELLTRGPGGLHKASMAEIERQLDQDLTKSPQGRVLAGLQAARLKGRLDVSAKANPDQLGAEEWRDIETAASWVIRKDPNFRESWRSRLGAIPSRAKDLGDLGLSISR